MKAHIYTSLLAIVEKTTEIPQTDILGRSKEQDIVDARHIFIYSLSALGGLSTSYIADKTGYSNECVRKIIVSFADRLQHSPKLFAILFEQTRKAYTTSCLLNG